ncbi:MAG: flagellar basal body P-ring protein FlgI [Pirellulaceae bacterium]
MKWLRLILTGILLVNAPRLANAQVGILPAPIPDPATAQTNVSNYPRQPLEVAIGDITSVAGDQSNFISGKGLVIGLAGTGAKDQFTSQMILNYARNNEIPITKAETKNCCMVIVTGSLPAGAKIGEKFPVTVSAMGDAASLDGGTLMHTELTSYDGEVYAVVQGGNSVPGLSRSGAGASVQKNHPTAGQCMAQVVKEVCSPDLSQRTHIDLILRNKEYETAARIASAINFIFPETAKCIDKGSVSIQIPQNFRDHQVEFIAMINRLQVQPSEPARVVINRRSGTIVMGHNVRLSEVVFSNENLIITTAENPLVSQPAPFSNGQTAIVPRTQIQVFSEQGKYNALNSNVTVADFAAALNAMGVGTTDLINVLESIRSQGGLHAELIIE